MDVKGAKMVRGDFAAEGRVSQHLKDVHLMLEQAERVQQQLPTLAVHADVLEALVRAGEGRPSTQTRRDQGDRPAQGAVTLSAPTSTLCSVTLRCSPLGEPRRATAPMLAHPGASSIGG